MIKAYQLERKNRHYSDGHKFKKNMYFKLMRTRLWVGTLSILKPRRPQVIVHILYYRELNLQSVFIKYLNLLLIGILINLILISILNLIMM